MKKTARAYVNIALIKYWGKKDDELVLPHYDTLSFTIDQFYTDTTVEFQPSFLKDELTIDGKTPSVNEVKRVINFFNFFRQQYNIKMFAKVSSINHVPISAGLASSSSAFAALALATSTAAGLSLSAKEISQLARIGSGSASRSVFGDFVLWHQGNNHDTSYAEFFTDWPDFRMLVCLTDIKAKKVTSRAAMKKSTLLSEYQNFVEQSIKDFLAIKAAISAKNIQKTGEIAQKNAKMLHQLINLSGFDYFNNDTQNIINIIEKLQEKIPVYYTIDAGPNVKLITLARFVPEIIASLKEYEVIECQGGPACYLWEENDD